MLDIDMNLKTDRELYQTAQKRKDIKYGPIHL